jgi:uncharacterized protein (UPF0335 family)
MNAVTNIKPQDEEDQIESTWDSGTAASLAEFGELVDSVSKKRKALNDQVAAGKSDLVSKGFNPDAIKAALSFHKTSEADRANWDLSYIYTRKALGCPVQSDLFEQASLDQVVVAHADKTPKTI